MLKFKGEQNRFLLWWSEIASWGKVGFGWRSGGGITTGKNTERVEVVVFEEKRGGEYSRKKE